jgi:excinuclease ABC subunit A
VLHGSGDREFKFAYERGDGKMQAQFMSKYEGVVNNLMRRYKQTDSSYIRTWIESFMNIKPCPTCQGARLKPEVLAVKIRDKNIFDATRMSIKTAMEFFNKLDLTAREKTIAHQIMKEVRERLGFLVNVGLDYLTLDRNAGTLSGGEAQRIRLPRKSARSSSACIFSTNLPSTCTSATIASSSKPSYVCAILATQSSSSSMITRRLNPLIG